MPILDPVLQFQLCQLEQNNNPKSKVRFFKKYLNIASKYIFKSSDTIKAYIQFKIDLRKNISDLKGYFKSENIENEIKNDNVPNFYTFVHDLIKGEDESKEKDGDFVSIKTFKSRLTFFQPFVDFPEERSWYLNDYPIAILCLRLDNLIDKHIYLIELEIDLMAAVGFTLVLCIRHNDWYLDFKPSYLSYILLKHHFSEIHINYNGSGNQKGDIFSGILNNYDKYDGYFYLYSQYLSENKDGKLYPIFTELKKKPRFKLIYFGDSIKQSLKIEKCENVSTIKYCNDGFAKDKIRIFLFDVPIYNDDDDINNLIPLDFALPGKKNSVGFIKKDDFLYWKKERVQIGDKKYVDFGDIHYINPDLFVIHTMYLGKVKSNEMYTINKIIRKTNEKYQEKQFEVFKKEFFITLFTESKAKKLLSYVLYAFKKNKEKFRFLKSQVFVAYKAIDFCVQHRFNKNTSGFVYEVATGEGKSSIVMLIAAVLALFGQTVHVVTSNIILANRDYNEYCDFFAKLGLKSVVLVHKNEIPTKFDDDIKEEHYSNEYFRDDLFKNSMEMNFYACGIASDKGKADIIFSNLINFESMYLYMTEKYPARVKKYYKKSSLVIDEADLILIDELANGTILSRPMKSNSEEILSYIYKCRCKSKKTKAEKIHSKIIAKWPECTDIKPKDIEIMFQEIDMVNEDQDFVVEKKYVLAPVIADAKEKNPCLIEKEVVPFNFDHTGILERNKEFNGYIQQFIALKERKIKKNIKENEILLVKDISMNYLYISHPIYIGFYNNVCGLTGTIGKKSDKEIFQKHYHLKTMKIPKENPNRRYEFPTILCSDEKERNEKIVNEIMAFHLKGNPVLVIFFSPADIDVVKKGIESHKDFKSHKVKIGVYNGKDDKIKPDRSAGEEGAISLGTNVCGRGTHIEVGKKSLHVIVSFFTNNTRAMNQAFGRTSRQNNFGTVRTICLFKEYISEIIQMNKKDRENSLKILKNVNNTQNDFINSFRKTRKWIFDINIKSQKIPTEDIKTMRSTLLNVNRINAYSFSFPLGMKYKTFLQIQAQKIFSLYNCPNSKYTWMLFQQYIREMILESWSLFLNRTERKYQNLPQNKKKNYADYLNKKYAKFKLELEKYFPNDKNKLDIVQTFMHIFTKVDEDYRDIILPTYELMMPKDETEVNKTIQKPKMSMIKLGFRPYKLHFRSGSKIYALFHDQPKISYIEDPELKYQRRGSPFLSITEKIDNIFDSIYNFFSTLIGDKIGFKFFMRRTLGGCEFGICYDFDIEFDDSELKELKNCLIDKEPLFVFSISVKSMAPFLAGVLIFFLLYLANLARQIADFVKTIPKLSIKLAKNTVIALAKCFAKKGFDEFEDKIVGNLCDYLKDLLESQIEKFKYTKNSYYLLFKMLSDLLIDQIPNAAEKIYDGISPKIKINTKSTFGKIASNGMVHIFKIGFLVVLCLASFMINFQINKSIKYSNSKVASEFTKGENYKDKEKVDNYVKKNEKILNSQIHEVEQLDVRT